MAKSIRSKAKRKNRAEFRNTIGQEAAKKNMEIVQSKLQECIEKGSMNSFERLSKIFGGGNNSDDEDMDMGKQQPKVDLKPLVGKRPEKVPRGKKDIMTKSKIRGPKKGQKVTLRTSSKKKRSV